jgi:heptosyltransferase II
MNLTRMNRTPMNRIGVWNTAFLGDAILTLPLIQTLKAAYPEAEIHFWVRRGLEELFSAQPELAAVHGFDKRGSQRGLKGACNLGCELSRQEYDLWISAHTSFRSALVARGSGAGIRIGYQAPWFNRLCYTHTVDREFQHKEEIERLLALLGPLGVETVLDWPKLSLPEAAQGRAAGLWGELGLGQDGRRVLGMHPGSVWATKRWPIDYFKRVAGLAVKHNVDVLVFAGPGEEELAQMVIGGVPEFGLQGGEGRAMVAPSLSLSELAVCIGKVDCYLSNDSGPMHLAWCQRVPLVALFGPTDRGLGFYPRGESTRVLEQSMECRPCGLHGGESCPKGHHACMRDILPETVWSAVAEMIGRG